ncbi:MAG TPA: DUF58 domain-containing protein [Thermoanaerobaculia bacterium]|nr:DUF58 domain-containing protein [Thermoanaerobaculia bacterium]
MTLILAVLALLVPVAVWIAPILAAAFIVLLASAVVEAVILRRTALTLDRRPRIALPLDEADVAVIRITTTATRPLRILVRQRWPAIVTPRSQSVHAICRPREVLQVDLALRGIARGMNTAEPAYASLTMFGLAERIVPIGGETVVHVLPNLRAVRRLHKRLNDFALRSLGARAAPRIGKGRDFDRLRDYVVDDDFRDIAWHASARHGRLIVREFRLDRSQEILLCVDRGHRMAARVEQITRLDHAVNAAVLISYVCNRMEDKFGLVSFASATENGVAFGRGAAQLRALTAYTSGVDAAYEHSDYLALAAALRKRLRHRTLILILTVLPEREDRFDLLRAVSMLAPQHLPLIVTLTDRNLRAAAQLLPSNRAELSRALVARDLWLGRVELMRELRSRGALVVEATPEDAGIESINAYIDVKRRQLL